MVVLHYTAMEDAASALDRLCDPEIEVSAHYLIGADGAIWHMIKEDMRAWHAGVGQWGEVCDVNSHSIGIELDNRGDHPFSAAQMQALERLLRDVLGRWRIPPERVIGHSDMAPDRKFDPGPRFDWQRLAHHDLAVWPQVLPSGDDMDTADFWTTSRLQKLGQALRRFGYAVPESDIPSQETIQAFGNRVAGFGNGQALLSAAQDLAERFPVDQTRPSA